MGRLVWKGEVCQALAHCFYAISYFGLGLIKIHAEEVFDILLLFLQNIAVKSIGTEKFSYICGVLD